MVDVSGFATAFYNAGSFVMGLLKFMDVLVTYYGVPSRVTRIYCDTDE